MKARITLYIGRILLAVVLMCTALASATISASCSKSTRHSTDPNARGTDTNASPAGDPGSVLGGDGGRGLAESGSGIGSAGDPAKAQAGSCIPRAFPQESCPGQPGYWGEALQKALWFFNVNKSGPGVSCTYVQWRGDSHLDDMHIKLDPSDPNGVNMSQAFIDANRGVLDPDGDGTVDLSGGFYDAGDYIKFAMTTAFSASTIAWTLWEYPESFRATKLDGEALGILRWFGDYLIRATFLDAQGKLVAYADQVGDGTDHSCGWMPPEVRLPELCPRKGYFTTADKPAADVTASAAASLALIALVSQRVDAAYSKKCLDRARALYDFAAKYPDAKANDDGGLYTSEYAYDDLAWAALWLYEATKNTKYLDDTLRTGGWLEGFPGFRMDCLQRDTSCWTESWTHCWNSVRAGVFLKLAQLLSASPDTTGYGKYAAAFKAIARENALRGPNGSMAATAAGFTTFASWGSGRYNSAAQFVALVYAKYFGAQDPEANDKIKPWAKRQMAYLLGDNPLGMSYMMGFTDNYASKPHHPAGHGAMTGQPDDPPENLHIIWGALVNGPSDGDNHNDQRSDYAANEVTIDYNASFLAAIAAHYSLEGQGQCPLTGFPPIEPPVDEFYTQSKINSRANACRSQVEMTLINHSVHYPRYEQHLTFRYYVDISELEAGGKSISDVSASLVYDNGNDYSQPTALSGPYPCKLDTSTYYYELSYEGYKFWGELVQLKAPRTALLDIGTEDGPGCLWDPSNDWSYQGLPDGTPAKSRHVPVYNGGKLLWGDEPRCNDQPAQVDPPRTVQ